MTVTEAKTRISEGAKFGDVYPYLDDIDRDGEELKAFFVHGIGKPCDGRDEAKAKGYTGDPCQKCGAMAMRRSGVCLTCDACGDTSGGCA